MDYRLTPETIDFILERDKSDTPRTTAFARTGLVMTEKTLDSICKVIVRHTQGRKLGSQRSYLYGFFKPFHRYFVETSSNLPETSDDWQSFVLEFFQFYLTSSTWTNASAKTRLANWSSLVRPVFVFWAAERMLPSHVAIPLGNHKSLFARASCERQLGKKNIVALEPTSEPNKLLVSVEFARGSADYLGTIERQCREKLHALREVCMMHWDALMQDGNTGARIAAEVTPVEMAAAIASGRFSERITGGHLTPIASPSHPQGPQWALALTKLWLERGTQSDCVSTASLTNSNYFQVDKVSAFRFNLFAQKTAMPPSAFSKLSGPARYRRFAGLLSTLDAAAACCLLTIEHPEFTADSLHSARLLNPSGKPHVLVTDDSKYSILSLDKPRAGSRKSVVLTPLAQKLLMDIIAWTAPIRSVLKKAGNKGWRYLFLGSGIGGNLKPLSPACVHLVAANRQMSLAQLYPELARNGLAAGTLDFRRIRTTMGVLRWFETGSVREMSRRIGNTYRMVIDHYLPPVLLHAWNERIIRRFQNTIIALAAHGEDYLLAVTDFTTISDLQHFLAQLLLEYPGDSSPLAKEVRSRLGPVNSVDGNVGDVRVGEGLLNIRVSTKSLSYLYAFSEYASNTLSPAEMIRVDTLTKLAPIQFVEMAQLIRHACESEEVTAGIRELLDVPLLRQMHQQATTQQIAISEQLSKLSIKRQWGRLDA